ncbi:MAG: PAS domain S-box protein [Desulfomonile tiedjei]|nr:PAS domain S-box protein [Desulfomonile tiedjei]
MDNPDDAREGMIRELAELRKRVSELEAVAAAQQLPKETREERFKDLVENCADWLWEIDARGRFTYSSPKIKALLGYEPEEIIGKRPRDLMPPVEGSRLAPGFERLARAGKPFERLENVHLHKDGRWIILETCGVPILDESGHCQGYRGVGRDITRRKHEEAVLQRGLQGFDRLLKAKHAELEKINLDLMQEISLRAKAEEAASEAETRLGSVLDAATNLSVIATDPFGTITVFNRGAERMLGFASDEVVGKETPLLVHIPSELADLAAEMTRKAGRKVRPIDSLRMLAESDARDTMAWTYVRKDGTQVPVDVTFAPIRDRLGEITGFMELARDVTERKFVEAELIAVREGAEKANRAKNEFLAVMSHEIRTPIHGVIGMTELVLDTDLTQQQRECLALVKSSAHSLLSVVNDILAFSKIESGKLELDHTEWDLRARLVETLSPLEIRAREKGIELLLQVASDVPDLVVGDSGRLHQVISNLVGNAIKFTNTGEVSVSIELESAALETTVLHFAIQDTGIGIPPDKRRAIFDPFTQADASTTRIFGGTGLGLAISRRLVEMMGGHIWVESDLGKGSCFHFTATFRVN